MEARERAISILEENIFKKNINTILEGITSIFEEEIKNTWEKILQGVDGVALLGFGSFGRKTMTPFSDIDILIIVNSRKFEQNEKISNFITELWNRGFNKIEHSVRTIEETLKMALDDVKVLSYLSDLRFIAGDYKIFERLKRHRKKFCYDHREIIFENLYQDRKLRISKFFNLLEPDIKSSPGGISDFLYQKYLKHLVQKDILIQSQDIKNPYERLLETRSILHCVLKKNEDKLNAAYVEEILEFIAKKKNGKKQDLRKFMTSFLESQHKIAVAVQIAEDYIQKELKKHKQQITKLGIFETDSVFLYYSSEDSITPKIIVEAFKISKDNNLKISPEFLYTIFKNQSIMKGMWKDKDCINMFCDIIFDLGGIARTLLYMRNFGVLQNIIPEFSFVKSLYQIHPPHIYPVDLHLVKCLEELEKILLGIKPPHINFLPEISSEKKKIAILSALLHDIGKGRKNDHSALGEKIAEKIGKRIGLAGENLDLLKFLVKNHLALSHYAQRRDIHEDTYIKKIAELFSDTVSLDILYILSIADALATNPNNWNSWKAHLITEIYVKLSERIRKGLEYAEEEHIDVSILVEDLKKFFPSDIVVQAVSSLSRKFLSFFNYDRLFRYVLFLLKAHLSQSRYVAFTKRDEGVIEIITIGDDVEGFLCECAGMLFISGFNILSLYAEGAVLGKAINIFWAEPQDMGRFRRFEKIFYSKRIQDILEEIQEKKRKLIPYYMETNPFANQNTEKTIKVVLDNDSSEDYTIIEVYCFDRPALLFDITYAITFSGYDISVAKISTRENKVGDVFYIRNKSRLNGKLSYEEFKALEEKIKSAIIQGPLPAVLQKI